MKTTAFVLLFISSFHISFSQKVSLQQFSKWKPRSIGPAGMSGRITAVDVVVRQPDTWFIGAASGGVWKTTNAGASWTPLFDDQPTLNIGSIAIQQSNPNVVWVGTGEGNPRNSLNIGEGIFKTLDGGKTWRRMGLEKTRNIHRIIIDPNNPDVVYAGVIGNPFASHPERGLYKTTDGGETWNRILFTNNSSGVADMAMDPSNPNKLIVNMWEHRRTPFSFTSGGPGSGLYITQDAGRNWKKLSREDGLPAGNLGRIGIAFARSMPSRVYALVEAGKNGLYKSDDGGLKWELITSDPRYVTNRPFYFQDIAVDTKNENRIYNIHAMVEVSEDGGKTFRTLLPYSGIHPDHHAWWIHPDDPNFILEGNDGGIGISRDRGTTWTFDDKIPVGQFYHINVDNQMPYNVMGGMQDNGSWHGPAYSWSSGSIRNYYWNNVGGGDGFDVVPDPEDPSWIYSMSQGGSLGRYNYKTGERWFIKPPVIDTAQKFRFNWNAAIATDPLDKNVIYYGSQFLHRSNDKGASWSVVSPDLTTNNPEQQKQDENGGLTLDVTGAENFNTIITIAPSYKESGVVWVGTDDGNVQLTRDGGKSWTNFRNKLTGLSDGAWIPQVRASQHLAGEAFVVANDYRRGDFRPMIYRTTDYGKTWTVLADEKKLNGYALTVLQDPVVPNLIFAGTEAGLWVSLDNGASFQQWKNGYPAVSTYDLAIQEREADLVIGTFGRALWVLDDIRPLRQLAATKGVISKKLTAFPAPDAYQVNYTREPGYDWSSYGLYEGQNRRRGAAISYFLQPVKDSVSRVDSISVKIYNEKNELVRSLKWKTDTGFNRQWWGLEERGVRSPGMARPRPNAPEPAGLQVMPGRYKVVLGLKETSDSTWVNVKEDPRLNRTPDARIAQRQMVERLRKSSTRLTEGMDRLTEWEEVATKMQVQLRGLEGKEVDSFQTSTKAVLDSIKAIREFINGRVSDRQGITRSQELTVMGSMQTAQSYIMNKSIAPGKQEEALVVNAEKMIDAAIGRINHFYAVTWKKYRGHAENVRLPLFKDYEPLR